MATFDSKTIVMMAENGHSVEIDGKRIQMTIVTDAETIKKRPDYSHLVGYWYKVLENSRIDKTLHGKHMKCFGLDDDGMPQMGNDSFGIDYHSLSNTLNNVSGWTEPEEVFDLSNPLDHNPSEVRVFDVPSEIKISKGACSLILHFNKTQALFYNTELNCYGVDTVAHLRIPSHCIATECKFEDLQEGDLVFATNRDEPDFTCLNQYVFLNDKKLSIMTDGKAVGIIEIKFYHYYKITAKP